MAERTNGINRPVVSQISDREWEIAKVITRCQVQRRVADILKRERYENHQHSVGEERGIQALHAALQESRGSLPRTPTRLGQRTKNEHAGDEEKQIHAHPTDAVNAVAKIEAVRDQHQHQR